MSSMMMPEKQRQICIGGGPQTQLCVVASNQSIMKETQKQFVNNIDNAISSSLSSSSLSALEKLHVSATPTCNALHEAERSDISLFATNSSKNNSNNNINARNTNSSRTGRMRNHSVSALKAGKGNTGKLTARDINRVIKDPHMSTNEAKIESWQRALRAERFLEHSSTDRKIAGRMTAQAFSDKRRIQLESMTPTPSRKDHVHQRPFTSLSVGSSASMRPHSTKPHKEELAKPPQIFSSSSTNPSSQHEPPNEELNLLYSRCKPRETFSRIGFRPSLEYLQIMERQDTGVKSSSKEGSTSNRITAYTTGSAGGREQGKIHRSMTGTSSSRNSNMRATIGYKDNSHVVSLQSTNLSNDDSSRPLGTGICLTNLCIEEEDEEDEEHDESCIQVGQAAPMVFSLENPEESTIEVLQLELDRESDEEDAFDETEVDLYRIQPRENPVPMM